MFQTATRYTNPEIHHLSRYCLNKLSTWTARGIGPEGALFLSFALSPFPLFPLLSLVSMQIRSFNEKVGSRKK